MRQLEIRELLLLIIFTFAASRIYPFHCYNTLCKDHKYFVVTFSL